MRNDKLGMKKQYSKTVLLIVPVLMCLLLFTLVISCDQEPLFWDVAREYPPIEPDIDGHPSKIVRLGTSLYVSNRDYVWVYDTTAGNPIWVKMPLQPSGKTIDLAVASSALYALDQNGTILKGDGTTWSGPINTHSSFANSGRILCIYTGGSYLFAGALTGDPSKVNDYVIHVINSSDQIINTALQTGLLMGVADYSGSSYLGTLGKGMYSSSGGSTPSPFSGFESYIVGLASGSRLYAVTRRIVQFYDGSSVTSHSSTGGYTYTGGISVWTHSTGDLLLVSLQRSSGSYGYGYREILIDPSGNLIGGLKVPGDSAPSSVEIGSQHISAIGKHAVNYLHVVASSDSEDDNNRPIIFASTAKNGLWSYRTRKGEAQWNGEDKTR